MGGCVSVQKEVEGQIAAVGIPNETKKGKEKKEKRKKERKEKRRGRKI